MAKEEYDLIVVGGGSGSSIAVAAAGQLGWRTALVEQGPLGGTCLNRGCIPSKMMIHAADVAETVRTAARFGIHARIEGIDFARVTGRANDHVDAETAAIEENFRKHSGVDLYKTTGVFTAPRTLRVDDREIAAERVLIAAGARPLVPDIPGLTEVDYWTSTEALRQTRLPASLVILGGGYIAAEMAHLYGALGCRVTMVQRSGRLLSREDEEIGEAFTRHAAAKYEVLLEHRIERVAQRPDGTKVVSVAGRHGSRELEAEAVLVALGLKPNTDILAVDKAGVATDEQGYVMVNDFLETSAANVWALGDVIGRAPFKHAANREAQFVYWNMTGKEKRPMDYSVMPHAVFASPPVAGVGLTEQEAKASGIEYEVRRQEYMETGMGLAMEAEGCFVKFLLDPAKNRILGCHILGPEAPTLIHEVVVAMAATGGNPAAISAAVHIHPALSEVVERAL